MAVRADPLMGEVFAGQLAENCTLALGIVKSAAPNEGSPSMGKSRKPWLWIAGLGLAIVVSAIGFVGYSVYRIGLVVRDAYSAENASIAIAKFIEKQKRPPGSWEELDTSIRDACAETGYNYEDVVAHTRIDFDLLKHREDWGAEPLFVTTETGAEFGNPTPNGRILEQLRKLATKPETPPAVLPKLEG